MGFNTELVRERFQKPAWLTVTNIDCAKCRSQIEAETRQKCWEDVVFECKTIMTNLGMIKILFYLERELKKEWRIVK